MKPKRRRLPLRHLVAAVGVAIVAAVAMAIAPEERRHEIAGVQPRTAAPRPAAPADPTEAAAVPEAPVAVRTVSGPGISPFPSGETPPHRVAPPERPKPPPPPIVPRRFALVKMEDTANFSVGDLRVRLPAVAVTEPDETCRDHAGTEWPCGRRALTGVRAVVRGKTIECPLPDKVRRGDFVTDCTLAGADMAERLVASGWARALDRDGPLGAVERQAEASGLGLHGVAQPIEIDPFPDPIGVPPDTTTAPLGTVGVGARPAKRPSGETAAQR